LAATFVRHNNQLKYRDFREFDSVILDFWDRTMRAKIPLLSYDFPERTVPARRPSQDELLASRLFNIIEN
jgi:hypothetical protein